MTYAPIHPIPESGHRPSHFGPFDTAAKLSETIGKVKASYFQMVRRTLGSGG